MTERRHGEPASAAATPVSSLTTSVAHRGEITVLTVAGEIDLSTASILEAAIDEALNECPAALIVDLSAVEFLCSVGLTLLTTANQKLAVPGRFAVVADKRATRRPIQLTGFDQVFSMHATLSEAIEPLQHSPLVLPD